MQQTQHSLLAIITLTLLLTACQQVSSNEILPTTETVVAETEIVLLSSLTPTPTNRYVPLATPVDSPTTPTSTPLALPTPTTIPVDASTPSAPNTPLPTLIAARAPSEVDLVTLEESLAVLDRMDKRAEPTSTPVQSMIFEGAVSSYVDKNDFCICEPCRDWGLTVELIIGTEGNLSGIEKELKIPLTGSREAITGEISHHPNNCGAIPTYSLQAKLTHNDQILEGTMIRTNTPGNCVLTECNMIPGKHWSECLWDNCGGTWTFSLPRK